MSIRSQRVLQVWLTTSLAVCAVVFLTAAKQGSITRLTIDPNAPVVDLFEGMKQGIFDVRVVPHDEFSAKVFITNNTDTPKTVKLPKAAVGVHILKQLGPFSPFGTGTNANSNGTQSGSGQSVGGNFQQSGNFNQSSIFTGNNGFFSIPPEMVVKIRFNTVCLNPGNPTPRPQMTYVLRRLEDKVSSPALRRLLENYDPKKTGRREMQAAAWHLGNEMSWEQLAAKQVRRIGLSPKKLFTRQQLQAAQKLVTRAKKDIPAVKKRTRVAQKRR